MPLSSGTRLGPYEIRGPLGAGGMGVVYRAFDTRLKREIALKTLPEAFTRDASLGARFEHEARAASALNHPNIVSVYDIGTDQGVLYMITELVGGESVRQLIARGPVPARTVVEIGKQIADGLAAAHAVGVVHRDIKPENILITADERVKIIDFGVAKQFVTGATGDNAETQTLPGMLIGTIGYMSPEQIRTQSLDGRSDIFSLGIVLQEMATGQSVFRGATAPDVMSAILNTDPPPLDGAQVPPGLGLIISRCLEKEPSRRFQNASDLAFAIRSLSAISTTLTSNVPSVVERKSRVRPVWAVVAAGLMAAIAAAYWFSLPKAKPVVTEQAARTAPNQPGAPEAPPSPPPVPAPAREAATLPPQPRTQPIEKAAKAAPPAQPRAAETEASVTRAADLVSQGQQLSKEGKYQDAVSSFSEAILLRPRAVAALTGRGNAYLALQQFDHAVDDLTHALELQPGMPLVHDSRGRALARQGQLDRALQDYNEAIRLKPDLAVSYSNRGHLYNQKGEFQLALHDFDEAIRLNPDAANAYEGRAQARFRTGDRPGAAADRKQAADLRK